MYHTTSYSVFVFVAASPGASTAIFLALSHSRLSEFGCILADSLIGLSYNLIMNKITVILFEIQGDKDVQSSTNLSKGSAMFVP